MDQLDAHAVLNLGKHFLAAVAIITIGLEIVNRSRPVVELLTLVVQGELAGLGRAAGGLGQELTGWNVPDGASTHDVSRHIASTTDRNWQTLQRATKRLCRISTARQQRFLRVSASSPIPPAEQGR